MDQTTLGTEAAQTASRWISPQRVSDIPINRMFEVECPDHGVIDQRPTYAMAIAARREHWFTIHKGERLP